MLLLNAETCDVSLSVTANAELQGLSLSSCLPLTRMDDHTKSRLLDLLDRLQSTTRCISSVSVPELCTLRAEIHFAGFAVLQGTVCFSLQINDLKENQNI